MCVGLSLRTYIGGYGTGPTGAVRRQGGVRSAWSACLVPCFLLPASWLPV